MRGRVWGLGGFKTDDSSMRSQFRGLIVYNYRSANQRIANKSTFPHSQLLARLCCIHTTQGITQRLDTDVHSSVAAKTSTAYIVTAVVVTVLRLRCAHDCDSDDN